jgi:hypothetical protein
MNENPRGVSAQHLLKCKKSGQRSALGEFSTLLLSHHVGLMHL